MLLVTFSTLFSFVSFALAKNDLVFHLPEIRMTKLNHPNAQNRGSNFYFQVIDVHDQQIEGVPSWSTDCGAHFNETVPYPTSATPAACTEPGWSFYFTGEPGFNGDNSVYIAHKYIESSTGLEVAYSGISGPFNSETLPDRQIRNCAASGYMCVLYFDYPDNPFVMPITRTESAAT